MKTSFGLHWDGLFMKFQIWVLAAWSPTSCTWAFPLHILVLYGELIPLHSLSKISLPSQIRPFPSHITMIKYYYSINIVLSKKVGLMLRLQIEGARVHVHVNYLPVIQSPLTSFSHKLNTEARYKAVKELTCFRILSKLLPHSSGPVQCEW